MQLPLDKYISHLTQCPAWHWTPDGVPVLAKEKTPAGDFIAYPATFETGKECTCGAQAHLDAVERMQQALVALGGDPLNPVLAQGTMELVKQTREDTIREVSKYVDKLSRKRSTELVQVTRFDVLSYYGLTEEDKTDG